MTIIDFFRFFCTLMKLMEQQNFGIKKDLLTVFAFTLVIAGILVGLYFYDLNHNFFGDLGARLFKLI